MQKRMNKFIINKEPQQEDKYYISVNIVIYRAKLGKFPNFLDWCETPRNAREGYPTKFVYLTEYTMLEKKEAERIAEELEIKYGDIIRQCEDSGDWSNSPFDFSKMDLLWSK
jgi:hypothetical protein